MLFSPGSLSSSWCPEIDTEVSGNVNHEHKTIVIAVFCTVHNENMQLDGSIDDSGNIQGTIAFDGFQEGTFNMQLDDYYE